MRANRLPVLRILLVAAAILAAVYVVMFPSEPASAVASPVGTVAIDLEPALPAANTCSTAGGGAAVIDAGDITSTLNNVPLNSPFFIDIVVDSVPAPGTSGIGIDFGFNDSIMQVTGVLANPALVIPSVINLPAGPIYFCDPTVTAFGPVADALPDTASPFRLDVGDLGGVNETGPGRVLSIEIECLSTGTSFLTLSDSFTGGNGIGPGGSNTIAILGPALTNPYSVSNELEATVGCNTTAGAPTQTPSSTPTPPPTPTPSPSATATATTAGTTTSAPSPTASPTGTPAATSTATPTPTATPTAAPSVTPGGSTPTPTATPTEAPAGTPGATTPAPTATPEPSTAAIASVWGDGNCSGGANPVDSLLTLRFDAGLSANTGDCPNLGEVVEVLNASPHIWGDVDCGGEVTPVDSLKLLRFDAGLPVAQEQGCPGMGTSVMIVEV